MEPKRDWYRRSHSQYGLILHVDHDRKLVPEDPQPVPIGVRSLSYIEHVTEIHGCLTLADFVAKVGQEQLANKNTQRSNRDEWILESILRINA